MMSGRLVVLIRKYTVCGLLLVTFLGCSAVPSDFGKENEHFFLQYDILSVRFQLILFSKVVNTMSHAPLMSVKSVYIVNLVVVMNMHEIFAAGR
jgi:hypothetical protein